MMWPALNAAVSLLVGLLMGYKLFCRPDMFSALERLGMGLLGAGSVMTVGPIIWPHESPYENWSGFLLRVGICVFFVGRLLAYDLRKKW